MAELPYLWSRIAEVGFRRLMTGLVVLLHRVRSDPAASEVVRAVIDAPRPEGASFLGSQTEGEREKELPCFANQPGSAPRRLRVGDVCDISNSLDIFVPHRQLRAGLPQGCARIALRWEALPCDSASERSLSRCGVLRHERFSDSDLHIHGKQLHHHQ